jgi:methionyl-tRNA formyltransferase
MSLAVVFAYGEVGVRCLRVLLRQGVGVPLLFSQEDDPSEDRWFGSVVETARDAGITVLTPADPNSEACIGMVEQLQPDFLFSFYYRRMLSDRLRACARQGALNMHGSLLPKYRGRAPVNWAILHGETETGASLHYMDAKPDAGALVAQQSVPILINDTALNVSLKVAAAAESVLDRCLPDLIAGRAAATPLDLSRGSYFGRRQPQDGRIDWHRPAREIHNLIRAVAPPFPGAFGSMGGATLRVLGSRYFEESARHRARAPCLYAEDSLLQLDCRDGRRVALADVELDGQPLTAHSFAARFGAEPVALN